MVFHVAGPELVSALRIAALEFEEYLLVRLAHDGGQHVEAAAVGHADDDFFNAKSTAALDDLLQCRNRSFTAIKAETLGAGIAFVEEALKRFCFDQLGKNRLLAFRGEGDALVRTFDPFLQPGLLVWIGNVHELNADGRAIGALEDFQHFPHIGIVETKIAVDEDAPVHVGGEPVGFRIKFRLGAKIVDAERIKLGSKVAAHAEGADHHDRVDGILDRQGDVGFRRAGLVSLDLLLELGIGNSPVAVKGGNFVALFLQGPIAPLPAGTGGVGRRAGRFVA